MIDTFKNKHIQLSLGAASQGNELELYRQYYATFDL